MACRNVFYFLILFLALYNVDEAHMTSEYNEDHQESSNMPPSSVENVVLVEDSDCENYIKRTKKKLSKEFLLEQGSSDHLNEERQQQEFKTKLLQDIKSSNINLNKASPPGENYYRLILKVNDALSLGLINRIAGTWMTEEKGIQTELYWVVSENRPLQLPSTRVLRQAKEFIETKERLDYCNKEDPIGEIELNMAKINVDSEPNEEFYKLVLKVSEAVQKNLIIPILGTSTTSKSGVSTSNYKITKERIRPIIRLPSMREKSNAAVYFKNKNKIENNIEERIDSDSTDKEPILAYDNQSKRSQYHQGGPITDLEIDMLRINSASDPYEMYYRLVLQVDKAVKKGLLILVPNMKSEGEGDFVTDLYRITNGNGKEVRLPSTRDLRHAIDFFNIKKNAEQETIKNKHKSPHKNIPQPESIKIEENKDFFNNRKQELLIRMLSRQLEPDNNLKGTESTVNKQITELPLKEIDIKKEVDSSSSVAVAVMSPLQIADEKHLPTKTETYSQKLPEKPVILPNKNRSSKLKMSNIYCRWYGCILRRGSSSRFKNR